MDANSLLNSIHGPEDIRRLDERDLPRLAREVRDRLIQTVSETGGHIGPNLGVVELTIALHRVFHTPQDKLVFDVSHQGYVHKMFTGRLDQIHTIRQYQGLNGFLLRTESEHDSYGAGHAGTALSAALGMAADRDRRGGDEHVIAVAGDAAFTCGPTFEALNNVTETTRKFIVVLNDNEWSIAKNVGAIARHFNRIATSESFAHLREKAGNFIKWIGGNTALELASRVEVGMKHLIWPSVIFEEFGLQYFGPIDGHDTRTLIRTFEFLKEQDHPVVLHIMTQKGRGYPPALQRPDKFHGLGSFKAETGETPKASAKTYSEVFGETLVRLGEQDPDIVTVTAAMPGGTKLEIFEKAFPDRYFDVGIAEEHAALFSCGMATGSTKPFLAIYSTFMQRAYDMIIHDMALQELNVRLCMDRAGLSGDDGPTHHGLFDIGYLRHIPGMVQMQPKDEAEFADMLYTMSLYEGGPIAIRYPRGAGAGAVPREDLRQLEIGKAEVVRKGTDVALLGLGNMFEIAAEAADLLTEKGFSVALINPRWIKPLDTALLEKLAGEVRVLCTIEDHVLFNGFGCAVMEHLYTNGFTTPVERVGWPDEFIEHGKVPILREKHGLTAQALVEKALKHLDPTTEDSVKSSSSAPHKKMPA